MANMLKKDFQDVKKLNLMYVQLQKIYAGQPDFIQQKIKIAQINIQEVREDIIDLERNN